MWLLASSCQEIVRQTMNLPQEAGAELLGKILYFSPIFGVL